jgi:RiboL-PSP-HEPN
MFRALTQFQENLKGVAELGALVVAIESMTKEAIDLSDILRAQIVLVVSALDHFIHELTRLGMIEASKGSRKKTDAFLRFQVPISAADSALSGTPCETWIGDTVRERHSWQSFQDPEKIADAIRLISTVGLWDAVGNDLCMPPQDVKTRLRLIIERRNKIAHEADMDPTNPGFRWPIDTQLVNGTVAFIEQIASAIYRVTV